MRKLGWVVAAAAVTTLAVVAPNGGARPAAVAATLRPGGIAFWSSRAPHEGSGVRTYAIAVRGDAYRLRVSYDHPDYRIPLGGSLIDPSGHERGSLSGWNSGEVSVLNPAQGVWRLEMYTGGDYDEFRMRATLERSAPRKPRKPVALLPNLQLVPPFEFTFRGPASGSQFYVPGPPVDGVSCSADDRAEHQAVRCLRFSLGPANVGAGPLQLWFPGNEGLALPGKATQVINWSDGHTTQRPAGEFQYHVTHAHYHHSGFGKLQLLKVTDPAKGTFTEVGAGPKQGFCTADVMIADWSRFNAEQNSAESNCIEGARGLYYDPTRGTHMGLSAGWADLYSWEQDGNYVEFALTNGDGKYVVRSTADALNNVLESNENDNTSYAYLEIKGMDIKVLERGRGQGPWDRHKVVAHDGLHPLADPSESGSLR